MKTKIIIILLFIIALMVFALQNTNAVHVKLWFWEFSTPSALLILVCLAVGVIIGILIPTRDGKQIPGPSKEEVDSN